MLIDTRNDVKYKEFNVGDYVMICGHVKNNYYHELAKGKILHKQKNHFGSYYYSIENFENGEIIDPMHYTIMDYNESIFNEFETLDNKIKELEKQEKELSKELHKIIPHRHF